MHRKEKRIAEEKNMHEGDLTFQPTVSKVIPNFDKIKATGMRKEEKQFLERFIKAKEKRSQIDLMFRFINMSRYTRKTPFLKEI